MKEKRLRQILGALQESKYLTVSQLAAKLAISTSTLRRDLDELVRRELVVRSKNGVIPASEMRTDTSVSFRTGVNAQAKVAIAKDAVKLIKSNSVIFLDSSSTVLNMANYLYRVPNVVVVTNSLMVVARLRGSSIPVYLIGGQMSERSHAFMGPLAEQAVLEYNFDYAFFSPVVITPQGYAAETTVEAASMRKAALERAQCGVLLCDSSKIGQHRVYNLAHINDFRYIITDDPERPANTTATVLRVKTGGLK